MKKKVLHILLSLASWGAGLLLIMPGQASALIWMAALFVSGGAWICRKHPGIQRGKHFLWEVAASVGALAVLAVLFYHRWLPSSKMELLARLLGVPVRVWVTAVSLGLCAAGSATMVYLMGHLFAVLTNPDHNIDLLLGLLSCLILAVITVAQTQTMIGLELGELGYQKLFWNILIVVALNVALLCLLGRPLPAAAIGSGFVMLLSTVNVYVYQFRGRLLEPVDIFSLGTALNVAGNYSLWPAPAGVVPGWGIWLAMLVGLAVLTRRRKVKITVKGRCVVAVFSVIAVVAICGHIKTIPTYHWEKEGAKFSGYLLDFAAKIKEAVILPPEGYDLETVDQLADRYGGNQDGETERRPHVIVIMDESFADLSVHGTLSTEPAVMPFLSSLEENTIRGYALASIYGGNTANSEFEFLTGNTMAWLSVNSVPYQQYIRRDAYSMVSYLKKQYGYHCVAMHPYLSSGWNRPAVYDYLGFDEIYFLEDFPQLDLVRGYVSDREMFESIIEVFQTRRDEPIFLFGVTMQNHGGYADREDGFENTVTVTGAGAGYPDVQQYLSLLRETDQAMEDLIEYFDQVEEDVVILFFGDHQPRLKEGFFRALGNREQNLEERQKRYQVPFVLWANYDIAQAQVQRTSLNYLSNLVYEAAGLDLPLYNCFLADMAEKIPAINTLGFYSNASGCYLPFDQASPEEQRYLAEYRILQYNSLWDPGNRSERFFPLP